MTRSNCKTQMTMKRVLLWKAFSKCFDGFAVGSRFAFLCVIIGVALAPVCLVGCLNNPPPTGPPTAKETHSARPNLEDRIEFVETYVTFRRSYEQLEYDVWFQNNSGGGIPGPSEWDVHLVAVVPSEELADWIPDGAVEMESPPTWSTSLDEIDTTGVSEWYQLGSGIVGLDRKNSVVVYRNTAT